MIIQYQNLDKPHKFIDMIIARVARVAARRTNVATHSLSTEVANTTEADELKAYRWNKTVTPFHALPALHGVKEETAISPNIAGYAGQLAGIPEDFKQRKAKIYRRARQTTSSSSEKTKAWKIEFNHQRKLLFYFFC